ncbi:MAG TPA: class I SAM-dependent methyltransferase [Opitutaceae bacterium]|nr:class I SAM-dependent methyltransferase [Opitutaceae bacterium]
MSTDPKQGEREYYARLGPEGIRHALGKPFSDDCAPQYFAAVTALLSLLAPPPRGVVEFGCGTGWLSLLLARRGYAVTGVDISDDAVRLASAAARAQGVAGVDFVAADYESFDGAGRFDYAIFHDALHHAESELAALRCAHGALAPGGCAITIEPGSAHAAADSSRQAVADFGVHEKSMPPAHIVAVARQAGFRRHLVLPHPHQYHRLLYRRAYHDAASGSDLAGRAWLSRLRSLWLLLRRRPDPGLVLLWK